MESGCTCNERTVMASKRLAAAARDGRPNGSAIRGLWYHRRGNQCSLLLKERRPSSKRQPDQKPTILPLENCISRTNDHEKLLSEEDDGFVSVEKCSKLCESAFSGSSSVCVESYKLPARQHASVPSTATTTTTTTSYSFNSSSSSSELWDEEIVLRHIKECKCTCNHMGYGNYLDWDEVSQQI